jgi:hypothetical protein
MGWADRALIVSLRHCRHSFQHGLIVLLDLPFLIGQKCGSESVDFTFTWKDTAHQICRLAAVADKAHARMLFESLEILVGRERIPALIWRNGPSGLEKSGIGCPTCPGEEAIVSVINPVFLSVKKT